MATYFRYFEYKAKKGENKFTNYMLRLACRYLEVVATNPIDINYVGILPQVYSVEENSYEYNLKRVIRSFVAAFEWRKSAHSEIYGRGGNSISP